METRLIDGDRVAAAAPLPAVIEAVRAAFAAHGRDDVIMPPKSYVELPRYNGDFRAMPCYVDAGDWDAAAVKWINVHPDNPDHHDLPTVLGLLIYSDPATAAPLAIMDGMELTRRRTAAAAAVASDILAVDGAASLGIIGAGAQAYAQVEAIATVRPIERVVVHDVDEAAVARFQEHFADRFTVAAGSVADAGHCDILCTLTPVRDPIVAPADVGERTHINAIGADAAGKQELESEVVAAAHLVIDEYEQCTHSGEINVPWSAGLLTDADIHAELGEIVAGAASGRTAETGVSVFDSTGLALQDVAAAHVVYEAIDTDGVDTFSFHALGDDAA